MPKTIIRFLPIVCGVVLLTGLFGCINTPTLPQPTVPNTTPVGLIDLRASDTPPTILYQQPPIGFVDGFFQGAEHGAVLGGYVGYELAKAFIMRTPEHLDRCHEKTPGFHRRGGNCDLVVLFVPVLSLMALVATPTITTPTVAIQGAFTSYSKAEVEEWKKALGEAQDRLQIQNTLRDHVARSITACCPRHLPPLPAEPLATSELARLLTSQQADTILQTDVLQLGLAEASSEARSESDSNGKSDSPIVALNEMFHKSRSSVYVLVRAKLLRADDNSVIDEREFGYLSTPRQYFEWALSDASLFRKELVTAYQSLAKEISYALVQRAPFS